MKHLVLTFLMVVFMVTGGGKAVADSNGGLPSPNVFISSTVLPSGLKRVLVLPLAPGRQDADLSDGCDTLDGVLQAELIKTGRFEVVAATPETVSSCTGSPTWTGEEVLPANFFSSLKNVYGCDVILFCELTECRSVAPLAIGWRFKLVDANTGKILWAADEVFDASNLSVAKDAEKFQKSRQPRQGIFYQAYTFLAWCIHVPTRSALDDQWNVLHSSRVFGEYSADKLLETLPKR
jgi:hypothetical protein